MNTKKPYVVAIIIQVIRGGMSIILKAAFNQGLSTFVFNFYCQAAASLLFLPIAFFRESILGGVLLIGGLYSVLWAKSKETTIEPCSEVNMTFSAQDEKEEMKPEENKKGKEEHNDQVSAYVVEQV